VTSLGDASSLERCYKCSCS